MAMGTSGYCVLRNILREIAMKSDLVMGDQELVRKLLDVLDRRRSDLVLQSAIAAFMDLYYRLSASNGNKCSIFLLRNAALWDRWNAVWSIIFGEIEIEYNGATPLEEHLLSTILLSSSFESLLSLVKSNEMSVRLTEPTAAIERTLIPRQVTSFETSSKDMGVYGFVDDMEREQSPSSAAERVSGIDGDTVARRSDVVVYPPGLNDGLLFCDSIPEPLLDRYRQQANFFIKRAKQKLQNDNWAESASLMIECIESLATYGDCGKSGDSIIISPALMELMYFIDGRAAKWSMITSITVLTELKRFLVSDEAVVANATVLLKKFLIVWQKTTLTLFISLILDVCGKSIWKTVCEFSLCNEKQRKTVAFRTSVQIADGRKNDSLLP